MKQPETDSDQRTAAVVLNWRDAEQTIACLASLHAEPLIDHVFLVDNEADGTLRDALVGADDRVTLIESRENRGFSAGVNLGIAAALKHSYSSLLMINNDAILHPQALARMRQALNADPRVGIVAPRIVNPDGSAQSTGSHLNRLTFAIDSLAAPERVDYLTWACVLLPRATLENVGLLDERYFMYWEDVDYGFRVAASGAKQLCVPDAVVSHNISSSHASAGSAVLRYSALGLSIFSRSQGTGIRAAASARMALKVAKQFAKGDPRLARNIIDMWRMGKRIEEPAFVALATTRNRGAK